ncbi:hypothetical protein B0T11DRAFT_201790, partial [Plectosphaerella cucumerina]
MSLDDDDNPLAAAPKPSGPNTDHEEEADADEAPFDMKLFASMFHKKGIASQSIRKGQKDFESHGTRAQDSALEASRQVIEDVLSYTRTHREEWNKGWFFPDHWKQTLEADPPPEFARFIDASIHPLERVVVLEEMKGPQGKSIGRTIRGVKPPLPAIGKVWLLPEEALFMVERGSLDLWWPDRELKELMPSTTPSQENTGDASDSATKTDADAEDEYARGVPLSLQAAYSLLIGADGERGKISLPKYEVYAHLKRSGYFVQRAPASNAVGDDSSTANSTPLWKWLFSLLDGGSHRHPSHGPLVRPSLYRKYGPVYKQLELIPRFSPSTPSTRTAPPEDPYKVFFHVWRPSKHTVFSKSDPPPPDFRIAVLDARETSVPALDQLDALWGTTPSEPPPATMAGPGRMYQRLKHGHRNVLLAIVDRGLVNFMRFGQGAFGEERLFE